MIKNTTKRQKLGWVIFIVYLIFLAYFLFFSEDFGRGSHLQEEYAYNLVPFKEIRRFIVYWHVVGIRSFLLNIVGNVVGFMPFGFFLPVISRRSRHWYNTVLLSFLFDVDDMILNTLGGLLGFVFYKTVQTIRVRRKRRAAAEKSILH